MTSTYLTPRQTPSAPIGRCFGEAHGEALAQGGAQDATQAPRAAQISARRAAPFLLALLFCVPLSAAAATTITVTSTAADRGSFSELQCLPPGSDVDPGPGATTVTGGATLAAAQAAGGVTLREAICVANNTSGPVVIVLSPATYTLTDTDNYWYGPNGLPPIGNDITIEGNGAVIERNPANSNTVQSRRFRFFFVSRKTLTDGIEIVGGADRASLILRNLTLRNGLARGGAAHAGGGGGGMGGAIFNQGILDLQGVTFQGNNARGGDSGTSTAFLFSGTGGGMGRDAVGSGVLGGGGFGPGKFGGALGGSALFRPDAQFTLYGCGGGAGFGMASGGDAILTQVSPIASMVDAGTGGGLGNVGGSNTYLCILNLDRDCVGSGRGRDGGGGGTTRDTTTDSTDGNGQGGGFGLNGASASDCSGGGGVGGGGAASGLENGFEGGAGGFGGGGGTRTVGTGGATSLTIGGAGGFGGGGASGRNPDDSQFGVAGLGGFAAGSGGISAGIASGGGGAGLGGALFNHGGEVTARNTTWTDNRATGGSVTTQNIASPGTGMGGAIFNLDGLLDIAYSTLSGNRVVRGNPSTGPGPKSAGGAVYNRVQNPDVYGFVSRVTIRTSILANSLDVAGSLTSDCNHSAHPDAVLSSQLFAGESNIYQTSALITDFTDNLTCTLGAGSLLANPQLLALADNGGATPTLAIGSGSPAIGRAGNCPSLATDQRGVARPQGAACDAGAYERADLDFGDAPAPYPTRLTDDGARHALSSLFLGACVDAESDGQPSDAADGDDLGTGSPVRGTCAVAGDDEDGVVFISEIRANQMAEIQLTASAAGLLDAWVDFDANGSWSAGEQIFADQSLVAGVNTLTFVVPADATAGASFARFRFSSYGGLASTGFATDGEVEDYRLTIEPQSFSVGGTVSGLASTGLVLQNNMGDDQVVTANGSFSFSPQNDGTSYAVTVATQPTEPGQTCAVTNGSGTLAGMDVGNVQVSCVTDPFSIGGLVSGLAANGLELQLNSAHDLPVGATGLFQFSQRLEPGSSYQVTVGQQPVQQTCTVMPDTAQLVGSADILDVQVICTTNPGTTTYLLTGEVTGLAGSGLVLFNNGGDALPISASGPFVFEPTYVAGTTYAVSIGEQPVGQSCAVSNDTGTLDADVITVVVICATDEGVALRSVGGSLSGLLDGSLVLALNDGFAALTLSTNDDFTFPNGLTEGSDYAVTVTAQPEGQLCLVDNGEGVLDTSDVTNINVVCQMVAGFFVVSATAGANGDLLGDPVRVIAENATTSFEVAAEAGYSPAMPTGSCPIGGFGGNVWTTGAITIDCTVAFTFAANSYTLNFDAQGGMASPSFKSVTFDAAIGELPIPSREGHSFNGWNTQPDGSGQTWTAATVYGVEDDSTLHAQWTINQYVVSLSANLAAGGQTGGAGGYDFGAEVTVRFEANDGYSFINWTEDGVEAASEASYTFGMPANDRTLVANVTQKVYPVNATAGAGGSISPASRNVVHDQTTTFTVTADTGFLIDQVSGCGGSLVGDTYTTAPITAGCTVDARFRGQVFELDLSVTPADFGQISCEPNPVPFGGSTVCTATPAEGFVLAEWTECAGEVDGNQCRLSNVRGPIAIGLRFEEQRQDPPIPVPVNNPWLLLLMALLTLAIATPLLRRQKLRN